MKWKARLYFSAEAAEKMSRRRVNGSGVPYGRVESPGLLPRDYVSRLYIACGKGKCVMIYPGELVVGDHDIIGQDAHSENLGDFFRESQIGDEQYQYRIEVAEYCSWVSDEFVVDDGLFDPSWLGMSYWSIKEWNGNVAKYIQSLYYRGQRIGIRLLDDGPLEKCPTKWIVSKDERKVVR